jgi:tetratricopeptide (TPR) repeat protein
MKHLSACACALVWLTATAPAVDFGDYASVTLTTRAWQALEQGALEEALAYVDKCVELYEKEAQSMQATRTAYAPAEEAATLWALNDVGTCLFIQGEVRLKQGDRKGARESFARVAKEFGYAQCWDPRGWFWKPADAARQKIVEIEFDEE